MKNISSLLISFALLSSCNKSDDNVNFDEIQGKWHLFSLQSELTTNNGVTITIDTVNSPDYYFEFSPDGTFLSTADGIGTYRATKDSLFIDISKYHQTNQAEISRFKYVISGSDLKLMQSSTTSNFKRM